MIFVNKKNQILSLTLFLFCFSLIVVFGIRNKIKDYNLQIIETKINIEKEKDNIKILNADYTNLSKFSRIEKIANEKLGLEITKSSQIVKITKFGDIKN